jgi:hypothetical protein
VPVLLLVLVLASTSTSTSNSDSHQQKDEKTWFSVKKVKKTASALIYFLSIQNIQFSGSVSSRLQHSRDFNTNVVSAAAAFLLLACHGDAADLLLRTPASFLILLSFQVDSRRLKICRNADVRCLFSLHKEQSRHLWYSEPIYLLHRFNTTSRHAVVAQNANAPILEASSPSIFSSSFTSHTHLNCLVVFVVVFIHHNLPSVPHQHSHLMSSLFVSGRLEPVQWECGYSRDCRRRCCSICAQVALPSRSVAVFLVRHSSFSYPCIHQR